MSYNTDGEAERCRWFGGGEAQVQTFCLLERNSESNKATA